MLHYSRLPDRAVLAVSGTDARDFLQGLITNDIRKVTEEHAVFAALLSPQGRFLHDFFIIEHQGRLLLETEKDRLGDLVALLTKYRLRSRVEFAELPQMTVAAIWGEGKEAPREVADEIEFTDPRLPQLGRRIVVPILSGVNFPYANGDYDAHRISLAVPGGTKDLITDRSILLEYGYDELGAVDFDKGCYVGQEVTARSKHRATLRKFIHALKSETALPPKGTPVTANGRELGVMASSSGALGLAHLRVAEVEKAAREKTPVMAGEVPVSASLPPWCKTAFAQD